MFLEPLLLLGNATLSSEMSFYVRNALKHGISPKTYVYSINIGLMLSSILLFLVYPFNLTIVTWEIVLIMLATISVRGINIVSHAKSLSKVSPMEVATISSLSIVLTYFVDILLGAAFFNYLSILFLMIVVVGIIIVSKGEVGFSSAKGALFVKVITSIMRGYLAYFAIKHMNSATYIFLMSTITFIITLPFTKYFAPTKYSLSKGIKIQMIGVITFTISIILASKSVTLYMLIQPATMVMTMLITYLIEARQHAKHSKTQIIGGLIALVGILAYALIQT